MAAATVAQYTTYMNLREQDKSAKCGLVHACWIPQSLSAYGLCKLEVVADPAAKGLVSSTLCETANVAASTTPCIARHA